jgi:hypothetical protein
MSINVSSYNIDHEPKWHCSGEGRTPLGPWNETFILGMFMEKLDSL